jgi:peroxiredoxin Q/BCP
MAIQIGDKLPSFKATKQDGTAFESDFVHEKPVVIYFYPKDFTPGCTTQACSFRDAYQDFQDLGAEVIGVSGDSVSSHQNFRQKHNLPFILLSDTDRKGYCIYIFDSISAKNHISKALEAIQKSK